MSSLLCQDKFFLEGRFFSLWVAAVCKMSKVFISLPLSISFCGVREGQLSHTALCDMHDL